MLEVLGTARSVNCVVRLCSKDSSGDDESTPLLKKPPQVSPPFHYRGMVVRVFCLSLFLLVGVTIGLYLLNKEYKAMKPSNFPLNIIYRETWGAIDGFRDGYSNTNIFNNIFIHPIHDDNCVIVKDCTRTVQELQNFSIVNYNSDVPYNFIIGGDGNTYEARGWSYKINLKNLNLTNYLVIGFIGDNNKINSIKYQLNELKSLISESIRQNKIIRNYKIFGLRNKQSLLNDEAELLYNELEFMKNYNKTIDVDDPNLF